MISKLCKRSGAVQVAICTPISNEFRHRFAIAISEQVLH